MGLQLMDRVRGIANIDATHVLYGEWSDRPGRMLRASNLFLHVVVTPTIYYLPDQVTHAICG